MRFEPDNIASFETIYHQVFPEISDWNGLFGHKALWYGLFDQTELIAFATVGIIDKNRTFLYNIGVVPKYRGKGFGKQIITELLTIYGQQDLYLFVNKRNRVAINLYRGVGFSFADRVFVPPMGEICMHREPTSVQSTESSIPRQ